MPPLSEQEEFELLSLEREKAMAAPQVAQQTTMPERKTMLRTGLSKEPFSAPDFAGMGYKAGGMITDLATNLGASPETAATAGWLGNATLQGIGPAVIGSAASKLAQPAMEGAGKFLMRSAINAPLKARLNGDAERGMMTMLNEGYNPTMGGAEAMRAASLPYKNQVTEIANSSPYVINPQSLYPTVREKLIQHGPENDVNPVATTDAIKKAWVEFLDTHPKNLTVGEAQKIKEGTYAGLGDKAYGIKTSEETAQEIGKKALARALKEKIGELEPATKPLLAKQSELLNAAKLAERRGGTDQGLKIAGLAPIASTTSRALAMLLDKYTLLKSLAARGLYSGAERIPQAGFGGAAALAQGNGLLARKIREQGEQQ